MVWIECPAAPLSQWQFVISKSYFQANTGKSLIPGYRHLQRRSLTKYLYFVEVYSSTFCLLPPFNQVAMLVNYILELLFQQFSEQNCLFFIPVDQVESGIMITSLSWVKTPWQPVDDEHFNTLWWSQIIYNIAAIYLLPLVILRYSWRCIVQLRTLSSSTDL